MKSRKMWDEVYANNSCIEFDHLTLISIGKDQTLSTYFSALCPALMLKLHQFRYESLAIHSSSYKK